MPHRKKRSIKPRAVSYRQRFLFVLIAAIVVFLFGFYLQYTSVTVYSGTLPCADCSGIKTALTLHGNHTYTLSSLYINKGTPYIEKGTWIQMEKNNMQVLQLTSGNLVSYYQLVNSTTVKMLDMYAQPIPAPFNLELQKE